ncbi:MAG TPA: SLC13 family permease, partial [Arenicellales bacterium]|nr:SLC13 family permease [Arenicellales bacterium]
MENIELTNEMIAVLAILGLTIFLFAFEIVRVDVAAVLILVILGLSSLVPGYEGLIDQEELFDGFASNAVISIIAVMIIGAGLDKTGVMSRVAGKILRYAGRTEQRIIPTVSAAAAAVSSFMQNVAAAALFLPVVTRISRRTQIPLSRLVMPMGFATILGGTVTMVGSSPLILLNDLIETSNRNLPADVEPMQTFHLFAVTPVGLALVVVGIAYFALSGRYMLPRIKEKVAGADNLQHFRDLYGIEGQIYELRVTPDSDLVDIQLRDIEERGRAGWILAVRTGKEIHLVPGRDTWIRAGSELAIMGSKKEVELYAERHGLALKPEIESFSEYLSVTSAGIAEVVIPPDSELINKTVGEVEFRKRFGAKILAVYRVNEVLDTDIPNIVFQAGDTLILHSRWEDLTVLANNSNFAVVTDFPR